MQRHPGQNWDDPAKDVSAMIQWLQANIGKYKGNPERMFIAAHSAGNGPLGTYIGRPEVWGAKGVGVKGAIFISGQWNIAPLEVPNGRGGAGRGAGNPLAGMGSSCGVDPNSTDGFINGPSRSDPRATAPPPQAGRGRGGAPDAATQVSRSTLPEFKKSPVKMMFITAELDPGIDGSMSAFYQTLHDELCKQGPAHCPAMLLAKGESHMSEVFSFDTSDQIVSGPVLKFIKTK